MQSIRLTDGAFAGRVIGKYGWSIAQAAGPRGAMVHREEARTRASSSTSLHVDVHLRQLRSMVQMVNVNVANKIEQHLQAERGLTERTLVREIRELALGNGPARAEQRQDGQGPAGRRQDGPPRSGQGQEGPIQAGTRQVVTPQARPRQVGAAEAGQGRNMTSRVEPRQDVPSPSEQATRRDATGAEASRPPTNPLTHRTARPSEQAARVQGAGSAGRQSERQGDTNAAGRNEAKQAGSPREERPDSETVAQLLARQQPPQDSERRSDRRLIELARRIEAIDPAGNPMFGMSRIGNATPFGRNFPIRVARNVSLSPQSLAGGIAERDEASRALRQATQWIHKQAWSGMPVLERTSLPEHRSRTEPGIVYRTMRALAAQDWNRVTVVERLRERLSPTGQTGRRIADATSERAAAQAAGTPRLSQSMSDGTGRAMTAAQAERGLAVGRRPATAALEPMRTLAFGAARQDGGEGSPVIAGDRVVSPVNPLGRSVPRPVADEARGRDESVPRATIFWSTPGRPQPRAEQGAANARRTAEPGQDPSSGDRSAGVVPAERSASPSRSANVTPLAARTVRDEDAANAAPQRATIVSAPTRRDDFLLVRALGQLARAGRLRERIEERHGLSSPGTTTASAERETRSERDSAPTPAPAPATIVVRANDGEQRASAPVARPAREPIGRTVLRPIATAGRNVPALVERVRKRVDEGLHAAVAAEQAMNRPGAAPAAASGAQSGTARQEHRQVRQVRLSPRETDAEVSGTARREGATGTGATATAPNGAAASAAGPSPAEATSRGPASATASMASTELRHAAAAGQSAQAPRQASSVSRTRVMPGPAAPDRFASHRTAMKHAMRAQMPLRRGNIAEATAQRGLTADPRPTSLSAQAPATTHLAAPSATARAMAAANPLASSPVFGAAPLVQAPTAASRSHAARVPAAPGQAPDSAFGPALVVPGAAPAASVSRASVDRPLPRLDVPARAAEKPGREEQAIRTLEVAVKTIEQELGQAKELWAKPKLDVNRLADEMVKAVAKRMKQDRQRRGI